MYSLILQSYWCILCAVQKWPWPGHRRGACRERKTMWGRGGGNMICVCAMNYERFIIYCFHIETCHVYNITNEDLIEYKAPLINFDSAFLLATRNNYSCPPPSSSPRRWSCKILTVASPVTHNGSLARCLHKKEIREKGERWGEEETLIKPRRVESW